MNQVARLPAAHGWGFTVWRGLWRFMRRWNRYQVEGIEHLLEPGAKLVVGYHGRGAANDMCILSVELYERLGYLPHGIVHGAFAELPGFATMVQHLAFLTDDSQVARAIAAGEHIMVTPGGTREACRPFWDRDRVEWGRRTGFARMAARFNLPIVPVGCQGADWAYVGLNDGYRTGKALRMPLRLPFWLGVGTNGLFPFALPLPVQFRQRIGAPIATRHVDPDDDEAVAALAAQVRQSVQSLVEGT